MDREGIVDQWDFEKTRKFFSGKRVVIVGSGPGARYNQAASIEAFDLVVRVNNYKTRGVNANGTSFDFTQYVGSRTDVHFAFYGSSVRTPREQLIKEGTKLCMCKCPNSQPIESEWHRKNNKINGIDFRYIYESRKDWWFCPVYIPSDERFVRVFNMLNKHIPSTGFSAIMEIMDMDPKEVYLTGFDGFTSGKHNMDEVWVKKNNGDPIGHDGRPELAAIKKIASTDKRVRIDKSLRDAISGF